MRSQYKWAVAVLSLGLSLAPVLSPVAHAADDAPKPGAGQGAPGGRRGAGGFLERYHSVVNKLNLTDDQKPKVEAAFAEAKTAVEAATKDGGGDPQAAREKMKPIREALTAKIEAVLTDDQKAKLKELSAAERPPGGGRRPASKPAN